MARTLFPEILAVWSPLRPRLESVDPACQIVQFSSLLTDEEFRLLAAWLEERPNVSLRATAGRSISNLAFLRFFPRLRHFTVDGYTLEDFRGLDYLSEDLESLTIGATRKRRLSLTTLSRFKRLQTLYLEGQQKDIEALGELSSLEDLTLRSITLPDLSALLPLKNLRSLDIKLGGTKNLGLLPEIGALEYVELWLVRGLSDVSPLAEISTLQELFLQALKRVTWLPSFAASGQLKKVTLDTMRGLTDLSPIAAAPNLEELQLIGMNHLQPEAVLPFMNHPRLARGRWGLGSSRKNRAAWNLRPLGDPPLSDEEIRALLRQV